MRHHHPARPALLVAVFFGASVGAVAAPLTQDGPGNTSGLVAADDADEAQAAWVWIADEDPAKAAERAAHEAVLQRQAASDHHAATLQTFLGRPPTWIQSASRVNLAEFPTHADPTDAADRQLRTLEWLLEERRRQADLAAENAKAQRVASGSYSEPTWLDALQPSTWLPVVREHRDALVATGASLLVLSWLLQTLLRRARLRSWRWRRGRGHRRGARGSERPSSTPTPESPAVHRERRRRRRRRSSSSTSDASAGTTWLAGKTSTRL